MRRSGRLRTGRSLSRITRPDTVGQERWRGVRAAAIRGAGSTFWLELELVEAPTAAAEPSGSAPEAATLAGGPFAVLYVEDNPSNVKLVEQILRQQPAVRLTVAMRGREGLELARQDRPTWSSWTCTCPTSPARRSCASCGTSGVQVAAGGFLWVPRGTALGDDRAALMPGDLAAQRRRPTRRVRSRPATTSARRAEANARNTQSVGPSSRSSFNTVKVTIMAAAPSRPQNRSGHECRMPSSLHPCQSMPRTGRRHAPCTGPRWGRDRPTSERSTSIRGRAQVVGALQ
jgi:hypothetical protein